MMGKYLHGYHRTNTPPQVGWTHWWPSVDNIYTYIATVFLEDGQLVSHTKNITPLLADFTDSFVREFAANDAPFFLWINHLAPHVASKARGEPDAESWGPPKPTDQYSNVLGDVVAPSFAKPSFNWLARGPHPYRATLEDRPKPRMQGLYTGRIRTLQDVDDAVQRLVDVLKETGELSNTYIFFVSDNGVLLGEHKRSGKNVLYREAMEVPLVVRVPGASQGTVSGTPVTTVDLAPTIAALAGVDPGRPMDGQSFAPLLQGQQVEWRDTQLIQTGSLRDTDPEPGWATRGVWTSRYTYIRHSGNGAEYLYDRRKDPYELTSVAGERAYADVLSELRHRRKELVGCEGTTCSRTFGPLPRVRR
jgi:arylsulfatase A-like enzyme